MSIREATLQLQDGHLGKANLFVTADSEMACVSRERAEPGMGIAGSAYAHQGFATAPCGIWQVFSFVILGGLAVAGFCCLAKCRSID